jgi:hypothetical protein
MPEGLAFSDTTEARSCKQFLLASSCLSVRPSRTTERICVTLSLGQFLLQFVDTFQFLLKSYNN